MLPSVDRAGRYFPLTFAALSAHGIAKASGEAWLDACEAAGRDALEHDTPPQVVAGMLGSIDLAEAALGSAEATWWSEGSARVERGLPGSAVSARCRRPMRRCWGQTNEATDVARTHSGMGRGNGSRRHDDAAHSLLGGDASRRQADA